jgi:hypothetical protein
MGGIMSPTKEEEIKKLLRLDDARRLETFLKDNQVPSDTLYTKYKRTLLQLSCYYESPKCLSKLIEMDYDYNKIEESNGNTPLFVSCKFNCLKLVKILLSQDDCKTLVKNNEKFNEFDIAFLKGNYQICYYLLYEYKKKEKNSYDDNNEGMKENDNDEKNNNIENYNEINTNMNIEAQKNEENENNNNNFDINQVYQKYFFNNNFEIDYYLSLQETNLYPLFNMHLFYRSLCRRIPPEKCESFAPERKRTKELLTKIPDPNETWGHFFKRIANLELYNPPLVDKKNVSQMNSMYMSTQMKLIENEYGVKLNYYKPENEDNINQDDEENIPIIRVKKKKNAKREKDNTRINDEETEKEKDNNNKDGNICVIKVNDYSSSRSINKEENKKDE